MPGRRGQGGQQAVEVVEMGSDFGWSMGVVVVVGRDEDCMLLHLRKLDDRE